jgi:hypothetical protein
MTSATHSLRLGMRWNVLLAGSLLSACAGGQTGGEDAVPPSFPFPGSTSDACVPETTPSVLASLDEMTAAGFSAASVLRYAEGTFHERLDFDPRPADGGWDPSTPLSIEPGGDEDLEIEISYEGGELRYFASESCPRLDIDVHVRLRTPSGAIEESVDGVLMASSPFEARLWLRFHTGAVELSQGFGPISYVPVPSVQRLAGDLSVTAMNRTGRHQLVFIELWLTLSELGVNGSLDGWIYGVNDESLRLAPLLATIGETCGDGGYGIRLGPEDQPLPEQRAPSAREVLALLGEMRIDAVRDDGSRSPLSLDLEYTAESACGRPGDNTPLTFDAVLPIVADLGDATIDGRWPLELRVRSARDGSLASVHVSFQRPGEVSVARSEIERLADDWGVAGLEVDRYDQVSITFDLTVEPGTNPSRVAGELLIRGYVLPKDRSKPVSRADGDVLGRLRFEAASGA